MTTDTLDQLPKDAQNGLMSVGADTIDKMADLAANGDPIAAALVQFWHKPERVSTLRENLIKMVTCRVLSGDDKGFECDDKGKLVVVDPRVRGLEAYLFIGPGKEWESTADLWDYCMWSSVRDASSWSRDFRYGTPREYSVLYGTLRNPVFKKSRMLDDDVWAPFFITNVPVQARYRSEYSWGNPHTWYANADLWLRILRNPKYTDTVLGQISKEDLRALVVDLDGSEALDILRPHMGAHGPKIQYALQKIMRKVPKRLRRDWIELVQDTEGFCKWKILNPEGSFPSWPPCPKFTNYLLANRDTLKEQQQGCLVVVLQWMNHLSGNGP